MERHLDGLPFGEPLRFVMKGPSARILRGHHRDIRQKKNEYRNPHAFHYGRLVPHSPKRVPRRSTQLPRLRRTDSFNIRRFSNEEDNIIGIVESMSRVRRALVFLSVGLVFAQQAAPVAPVAHVSAVMKDFLRGLTENRFDVRCKISFFDSTGKLKRVHNTTHRLEFTKGRFRGEYSSTESDWTANFIVSHTDRGTLGLQTFTDNNAIHSPAFVFSPGSGAAWTFQPANTTARGPIAVAYRSTDRCATFEATGKSFRAKETPCGTGEVTVDENGAIPLRTTFEALGLPLSLGKRALTGYRVEGEFQNVAVAPTGQLILSPKTATATILFDDEKIVVESAYTLHTGKW